MSWLRVQTSEEKVRIEVSLGGGRFFTVLEFSSIESFLSFVDYIKEAADKLRAPVPSAFLNAFEEEEKNESKGSGSNN